MEPMRKLAAMVLLATAACSSFGSESVAEDGGTEGGTVIADGGAADAPTDGAPAPDLCKRALADPRAAVFTRCLQYDDGAAFTLNIYNDARGARGGVDPSDFRSPPAALALYYPANPPAGGNGVSHVIPVPLRAKRAEISFDVRLEYTAGTTVTSGSLAGYSRGKVRTDVFYDFVKRHISVIEQDQRTPQTLNSVEGLIPVDLASWHRITLFVDFEQRTTELRVDNGTPVGNLPLDLPFLPVDGEFVIGAPYVAGNTAAITYRFDDVVMHAW